MVNPPPFQQMVDAIRNISGQISAPWQGYFDRLHKYIQQMVIDFTAPSYSQPSTGFNITLVAQVTTLDPAGVLATGTLIMPATPYDGMPILVSSTKNITSLTLSPNTGQTVMNAPSSMTAGSGFKYYYNASKTTWYRLY